MTLKAFNKAIATANKQATVKEAITGFNANKCVCCGKVIPEGEQVCYECSRGVK